MSLIIEKLSLGPIQTNCYLLADSTTKDCVVVDPSGSARVIQKKIESHAWKLTAIWLTHAHWDHWLGLAELVKLYPKTPLGLHILDLEMYQRGGGAAFWGIPIEVGPAPQLAFEKTSTVQVGHQQAQVLFVPGHAPGHVAFYFANSAALVSGDVLFAGSIGRTDLPGCSYHTLLESIRTQLFTLLDETVVYPGHGENTTIGVERRTNPFLRELE